MVDVLPLVGTECCSALPAPLDHDQVEQAAARFKALSDPTRVQLLHLVAGSGEREACVCDLTDAVGLSQGTVSHHLKTLVQAGFLERERRGTWAWYRIAPGAFDAVRRDLEL